MSSFAADAAPALSAEDLAKIEEYEKIVKFSEDVLAGRHPRVKINLEAPGFNAQHPGSLRVPAKAIAAPAPTHPAEKINFRAKYYNLLGVTQNVSEMGLKNALKHKNGIFSPESVQGKARRAAGGNPARYAEETYLRIQEAYRILSNPELRARYDAGCI